MPQTRGGANCAVATCKHKYYVTKHSEEYIGYHRFPKNEQLRKIWVDRCGRKDSFNPNTSYICSVHFNLNDFERNYMSQFGLSKKRDILKRDAIPTQKLRLSGHKTQKLDATEDLPPETMGPRGGCQCSVGICKNRWSKTKNRVESPVSYHNFPKDPKLKEIWIKCCKREGNWNPATSRICSDHFTADQFLDDVEARIMGLKRSKKLKPGAFPTIKLNLNNETLKNYQYNPRKKFKTETVDEEEEYTLDSDDVAEAKLLDSDLEDTESPLSSDQEVQIIKVIKNKNTFNNKSDNGLIVSERGTFKPLLTDQDVPHSLKCPFLEENKCLKEEVKSLKMKIHKFAKSIESLTKKNAALETALMKCLTLKASPPDIT